MKQETIKRLLSSLVIIPFALFFTLKGSIYFNFFLIIIFLITIFEWYKMSKNKIYLLPGVFFLIFSFYSAYLLRFDEDKGLKIFILVVLISVTTDIGGYIFGNIFKGPKLTKISPKKTYSGVLGSYFLSIISSINYIDYYELNYWTDNELFIIILLISSISQIGDLIISYFKRKTKIKNTGKIIPGHGGFLDRIDGIIFAVPFAHILLKIF